MTCYEGWSLAVQAVGAVGALIVAIIAIWGDYFRARIASPRLGLRLRAAEGELTRFGEGSPVRYYHLVVTNSRDWAPARNVLVFLVGIDRPGPNGGWQPAMPSGPIPLNWQFGPYSPGLPTIGPERICDLARVAPQAPFEIIVPFKPNNFDGTLKSGRLRVHVMAVAENAAPARLVLEVGWDGQWAEGSREMASHLVINEVPVQRAG